jgi:hypothetical protein
MDGEAWTFGQLVKFGQQAKAKVTAAMAIQ